MGKGLLILIVGFAASFGILAQGKNQRYVESVDRMVDRYGGYTAKNASASGAYMALNQLYLDPTWRAGYNNLTIGGNVFSVSIQDQSQDAALGPYKLRILANGGNADGANLADVTVFTKRFQEFAVWAKDTVQNVNSLDSLGNPNANLTIKNAPFMPKIDKAAMTDEAANQNHLVGDELDIEIGGAHFHPSSGFPNNSFYYDSTATSTVPNVIHVNGDLHIRDGRIVYGIYIVEGDVLLNENAKVRGVLYLPNPSSRVYNRENASSQVQGGIVTWGEVDGDGYPINVRHRPKFLYELVSNYASNNPPLRVLTWK